VSTSEGQSTPPAGNGLRRAAQIIVISSVTFTFISYWRTAAVVLCDLGSTAYYIGGIVEQSIGKAAPWFILAVMVFSYAVRSVYIESCTLFVRGGVYRVVKEAMGGFLAKLSVSALMFDYILTGPISGVSAGQYIVGLVLEIVGRSQGIDIPKDTREFWKAWGSVFIACAVTIYFFRKNVIGIHESSEKAFKIMVVTTIMAVLMLAWCGLTLLKTPAEKINSVPLAPDLTPKRIPAEDEKPADLLANPPAFEDHTGFLRHTRLGEQLKSLPPPPENPGQVRETRPPSADSVSWLSLIGFIGICIAFGHSVLAMSGEETLAQVYREVESPKLPNFKKAAFIVFVYSLVLTAGISFLAVMLIPDTERMPKYADNLIGGLAMNVWGPEWARLLLNGFVVVVGFLILAGAVNTAIIGSNGVLNRVAEDGVMPDWFLKPHPKYGTSYRVLYLILGLQLFTIIGSKGDVLLLGEAYAFGVVWSFVFKALAMVVLRFKDPRPRAYKVPFNIKIGRFEVPIGLSLIFLVLLVSAIMNLCTKEMATTWGLGFTAAFLTVFLVTEHYHERRRKGAKHEHLEQFNQETMPVATSESLGLTQPYRKLVAIRSPQNLFMLEKALAETDPETTGVVVMTAKLNAREEAAEAEAEIELDVYDQQLMTAVVNVAEKAGKKVKPVIVPTNNPLHAVVQMAKNLQVQELVMGASNKYTADEQLEQIAFFWITLHNGETPPLTVRLLSRARDVYLDLGGGNRIPKISERKAKSVAELRAAGVGVERVLLAHNGTLEGSDMLQTLLTMLDPDVPLGLVCPAYDGQPSGNGPTPLQQDQRRARKLGRELEVHAVSGVWPDEVVRVAREFNYNLIVLPMPVDQGDGAPRAEGSVVDAILRQAPCRVFLAASPPIPRQPDEEPPAPVA
jgi:amino acid transporter/nucleotide-binding universal stress UspA family protein